MTKDAIHSHNSATPGLHFPLSFSLPQLLTFSNKCQTSETSAFLYFYFLVMLFHLSSCMLFNIDGHQVPQHIMMEVGDTYKRILAEVRSLLHMASVASFNHESGCGYLKQESNGFLVRYLDSKSEG